MCGVAPSRVLQALLHAPGACPHARLWLLPTGEAERVAGTRPHGQGQEIAFAAFTAHNLPDGVDPTRDAEATIGPDPFSFPHGTHLCAAEVDTETGMVTIRSYVAVDDVGNVINPQIVEGQLHGGIAQG